jgi:hypothetical protein
LIPLVDCLPFGRGSERQRNKTFRCPVGTLRRGAQTERVPMKTVKLFLAIQLLSAVWAAAQGHRIKPVTIPASSGLPKSLQGLLQPQGTRLLDRGGEVECEIWWNKAIPTKRNTGASDIAYGNLAVGVLLGVMHLPKEGHDYRGQAVKPGYYTLRYALMPADGKHMGVSSYRDFALLIPAGADTRGNEGLPFDALLKLSRQATGTGHPAVFSLVQVNTAFKTFPVLSQDDEALCILQASLHGKLVAGGAEQDFPMAVILIGSPQGGGAS